MKYIPHIFLPFTFIWACSSSEEAKFPRSSLHTNRVWLEKQENLLRDGLSIMDEAVRRRAALASGDSEPDHPREHWEDSWLDEFT